MPVQTFRARTIADALRLVREELGPDASLLETREIGSAWSRWFTGAQVEVTASAEVQVPSRLPGASGQWPGARGRATGARNPEQEAGSYSSKRVFPAEMIDFRQKFRSDLRERADEETSLVAELASGSPTSVVSNRLAAIQADNAAWTPRLTDRTWPDIPIAEPLSVVPGRRVVVALVGPTGVGKTTTIAKLAAHYRLREQRRVGLVTVDTYRVGAVDQLRAYAEIMDLPLQVVTDPSQMREALDRLADVDLVLIDTAGRSPRDAVRLAELRRLLAESQADEVQLVLSAASGPDSIDVACGTFSTVGASALILTKLDEAVALDWLPSLVARHRLPLSYTTSGQNVPDDIQAASGASLAALFTGRSQDRATERQRDRETEGVSATHFLSVSPSLHHSV